MTKEQVMQKIREKQEMRGNANDAFHKLMMGYALTVKDCGLLYDYITKLEKEVYKKIKT